LHEIATLLNAELSGNPDVSITGVQDFEHAGPSDITFWARTTPAKTPSRAGAVIVKRGAPALFAQQLAVEVPHLAFARCLELFHPHRPHWCGISPQAWIDPTAHLEEGVRVGPFATIGPDCHIGAGSEIHAGVHIYRNTHIGTHCLIYSGAVIREDSRIGNHVIIHCGAVIGADGFGYVRLPQQLPHKIPQVGYVAIGDHCEIGANTCIDRSTVGVTLLEAGVKLDNQVQIGHNVKIGPGTSLSAQCGISGSTTIGADVIMGGQVGVADHISVGDRVMAAGQTGITGSVEAGKTISGTPHQSILEWRRNMVALRHLDDLVGRVKALEAALATHQANESEKTSV
jgi:UDP-3-O-[3-hydroxymyristoyl] glucosamine N-acyltransferase